MQRPIRRGVVGHTLMVEELGCRKVNCGVRHLDFKFHDIYYNIPISLLAHNQ